MTFGLTGYALAALASAVAGAINALAGGGTLLTFPVLTALGLSSVSANVTNTVALLPGYLGGAWAQRSVLARSEQRSRLLRLVPASLAGGLAGAFLLGLGGEGAFRAIVPYLILLASALLAVGDRVKALVASRSKDPTESGEGRLGAGSLAAIVAASVYGGYFGAGVSVILLAVLGIALDDSLSDINALKQAIALSCNAAAAVVFAAGGMVDWPVAAVMALSALGGGVLGGALADRMKAPVLRALVVSLGLVVGLYFLFFKRA